MKASYLAEHFAAGLAYEPYVRTGTEDQQRRWQQVHAAVKLTPDQSRLLGEFTREMRVLVVSGIWCGDCIQQCPIFDHFAAKCAGGHIQLRFVDRDQKRDLSEQLRINAGDRVPVVLFLAEDHELCAIFGDRPLSRYRALAARQLGPSCPLGLTPPDGNELAATTQDWFNEFERVQLMLRLSARLRQKHGD